MNSFDKDIYETIGELLRSANLQTIQVNVGLKCNQSCTHCHLDAFPQRTEMMDWTTMEAVGDIADSVKPNLIDITGGSPELHPDIRRFITELRKRGHPIQVRTNLTVFYEDGMEGFPEFYRDNGVMLVASMPCYLEENVRAQRGERVYEKSIDAVKRLNSLGYGSDLSLNLIYNPGGSFLPAAQVDLENDYKRELGEKLGIVFNHLFTITNMPLGRFRDQLHSQNKEEEYLELLRNSFNKNTIKELMCRYQISVGPDGTIYDCDFNLALEMPVSHGAPDHISRFDLPSIEKRRIATDKHCYGCTAGAGSSCAGSLA